MGSILCHYITALFLFVSSCLAHVSMSDPPPIRSSKNPYTSSQNIDYDYSAPLSPSGSNYPCKGYQKDTPVKTVKSYQAGETYEMGFTGSATHMGGSCQISLSYDNGDTFKVIKSMIGGCPQKSSYNFTIPSSAPSGNALIAWTWLNYEGNREFYMNCAWVAIDGSSNGNLNSLPNVWVANVKGVTDCTTEEKEDPVFPHPGPDVEYGNGESSSSTPTPGDCEAGSSGRYSSSTFSQGSAAGLFAEGAGPAVDPPQVDHSSMEMFGAAMPAPQISPLPVAAPPAVQPGVFAPGASLSSTSYFAYTDDPIYTPPPSYTTVYVEEDCTSDPFSYTTVTVEEQCSSLPDVTITVIATTVTAPPQTSSTILILCSPGYYLTTIPYSGAVCRPFTSMSMTISRSTTVNTNPPPGSSTPQNTWTTSTTRASQPSQGPAGTMPPYATDTTLYLPCIPGKFLCNTRTSFYTCGQSGPTWTWLYRRAVAEGMECLPFLSPMSSSGGMGSYGQEPGAPVGYYRDDRYVRYRAFESCAVGGSFQCVNGGYGFQVCDHGGWVDMGAVAEGTVCVDGKIRAV